MKAVELAKRVYERREKYFKNLDFYIDLIKKRVGEIFPDAKIYLKEEHIRTLISTLLS